MMLPRYYQSWLDYMNMQDPKANYTLLPDMSAKGAGRRLFLRYIVGPKNASVIDGLKEAQLDQLQDASLKYLMGNLNK